MSEAQQYLEQHGMPKRIDVLVPDCNGILRGKWLPGKSLEKLFSSGVNFPVSLLFCDVRGDTPWEILKPPLAGDPDITYRPVPGSLRKIPWSEPNRAQIMLRATGKDGKPLNADPRTVLETIIARLNADNLYPVVAMEGEFYVLDPSTSPPSPAKPANGWPQFEGPQVYAQEPMHEAADLIGSIERNASEMGVPLSAVVCEFGAGQFECNLDHSADPVAACDGFLMLKQTIKAAALAQGNLASFMAMPLADNPGSGMHIHVSLLDSEGINVFAGDNRARFHHAIGGVLETMPDTIAALAPVANSYRRFKPGGFAPYVANWGENHRGVAVRIPTSSAQNTRFEHRIAGGDANPFLVAAAVLAGAHYGISNKCDPGEKTEEGQELVGGKAFPSRWRQAIGATSQSSFMKDYFGPEFVDMFCRSKFAEEQYFHSEISDRDLGWCLRTI